MKDDVANPRFPPIHWIFDDHDLGVLNVTLQGQDHNQQVAAEDPMDEQEKLKTLWQKNNICPSFCSKSHLQMQRQS
jgi:hypothetical protein